MEDAQLVWWKRDAGPRLAGLALAGLSLALRYRPLPMMLEWAQRDALLNMSILIWPLAMLPWLIDLPLKRQMLWLSLGVVAGFWAMGYPLFGVLHGMILPNITILPQLIGALLAGFLLFMFWGIIPRLRWADLLKWCAPLLGLGLLWLAVRPTNAAISLRPGEVRPGSLAFEVSESYELQSQLVAAYTYEDLLVAIGQEEWLWRGPDGVAVIRPGSYDPWRVQVHCDGQRLLIAEPRQGRVECYNYPDGELLWKQEELGELLDMAWTADYAWALNCPDFDSGTLWPWPEDPQVVLHRLDLSHGADTRIRIEPPGKRFWKHVSSGPLAWLESNEEQAWVAGWCSLDQPVYQAPNYYEYSETDLQFIFRPAQGELEQRTLLLPDGLQIHHDLWEPISYYLQGDVLVDVMHTTDGSDYVVRARSLSTEDRVWERKLGRYLLGQSFYPSYPFQVAGRVLLDTGHELLCLDEQSGAEHWSFPHSSRLRWAVPVHEDDVIFGLADGTVARLAADGEQLWQYDALGFTSLECVATTAGAIIIRESGITESAEWVALLGSYSGKFTALSLDDGSEAPMTGPWLQNDKFAVAGEFVWHMQQFTYRPGPYNGDKAIYRLNGDSRIMRDLRTLREDMVVRPDYLLVAEEAGSKARLVILRVKEVVE